MELTESIETINRQLVDLFGVDTASGQAMWRVVWAEDQFEKRLTDFYNGVELLHPEVKLLPTYSWIKGRYILEHLVGVPEVNIPELPTQKITYTLIWTFEDKNENYLPPNITACKFVINLVESAMLRHKQGLSPIKKYIDEEYCQEASLVAKAKRLNKICEELYGEDASFHDNLLDGSGVVLSDKRRN
jgi:hypothetical protein